jgi:hypothetical protein
MPAHTAAATRRYIPDGATVLPHPEGEDLGVVYTYISPNRQAPAAVAYRGRSSSRAWHYRFPSEERRTQVIDDFFADITRRRQARAAERDRNTVKAAAFFAVGDIVVNTWGYDQTNVDFYKVKRVTNRFVDLVRIAADITETGFMSGHSTPDPEKEITEDYAARSNGLHKVGANGWVNFKYGAGRKWSGSPESCSWYA